MCLSAILNVSLSLNFQCLHCNKKVPFCYIAIRAKMGEHKNRLQPRESVRFSEKIKKFKKVKKKGGQKGTFLFHSTVRKLRFISDYSRYSSSRRRAGPSLPRCGKPAPQGICRRELRWQTFTVCDASHRCRDAWVPHACGMTMLWNKCQTNNLQHKKTVAIATVLLTKTIYP